MSAARAAPGRRGQPLWALGGVLLGWVALRATLIDWPALPPVAMGEVTAEMVRFPAAPWTAPIGGTPFKSASKQPPTAPGTAASLAPSGAVDPGLRATPGPEPLPLSPLAQVRAQRAAGHNLLWMAAMGAVPLLPEVATAFGMRPPAGAPSSGGLAATTSRGSRWSGDAWLAWRAGPRGLSSLGPVTPVYGASQAGALLRYELVPATRARPAAYIRAVAALESVREQDVAVGLSALPIAGLPLTAHGELRLSRRPGGTTLRPAAFVSGGIDAAPVGLGITARGYAQAGYVGGDGATAFADGGLIAERPLWAGRDTVVTAGAGTWGGAQRGAARLDLGPTASLRFRLGETAARLSADYRLRVAGNAEPASGAALTLSAGF